MLKQRILTALILAPAVIAAVFYLPLHLFAILLLAIVAIGAWEWAPLMGLKTTSSRISFVAMSVGLVLALWTYLPPESLWTLTSVLPQTIYILWLGAAWWLIALVLTLSYPKSSQIWSQSVALKGLFGLLTLVPMWLAFMVLRSKYHLIDPFYGAQLLMVLFLMVWSADIGAYFVGRRMGKRKLLVSVSPGKTIEGMLGGIVVAVLVVALIGVFMQWSSEHFFKALIVTAIITTVSVLGDLTESMFKRQAGIKDSGTILPGHGGILDRIDSLTATAPIFALCYLYLGW